MTTEIESPDWLTEVHLYQRVSKAAEVRQVPCPQCDAPVGDRCRRLPSYRGGYVDRSRRIPEHAQRRGLRWQIALRLAGLGLEERT